MSGPADPDRAGAIGETVGAVVGASTWPIMFGVVIAPDLPLLAWGKPFGLAICAAQALLLTTYDLLAKRRSLSNDWRALLLTTVLIGVFLADVHKSLSAFTVGAILTQFRREAKWREDWLMQVLVVCSTSAFILASTLSGVGFGRGAEGPAMSLFSGRPATFGVVFIDFARAFVVMLLIVAQTTQTRRATREEERALRLEAEREEALRTERSRIARDLHDVVAHHVSVMTIQAEAARETLPPGAAKADTVLERVSATGREALTELRRLLGVLRENTGDDGAAMSPQPGADRIPELVDRTRASGVAVDYEVRGEPRSLPVGVDVCAYRIVQEALTNVLKHAGATTVAVTVAYGDDVVDIEVLDNGVGDGAVAPGGQGQAGMRERAALVGGSVTTGRVRGGGYRVAAHLPVTEPPG